MIRIVSEDKCKQCFSNIKHFNSFNEFIEYNTIILEVKDKIYAYQDVSHFDLYDKSFDKLMPCIESEIDSKLIKIFNEKYSNCLMKLTPIKWMENIGEPSIRYYKFLYIIDLDLEIN